MLKHVACAALVLASIAAAPARAATTTNTPLNAGAWTPIGTGPLILQVPPAPGHLANVQVVLSDSPPSIVAAPAFTLSAGQPPLALSSTSTFYARSASGSASINSAPVAAASGGGGGGSAVTQATTPWVDNVSQFGGANVVTGTGAGGAGIPRVTVSSDSSVLAQLYVNGALGGTAANPVSVTDAGVGTPADTAAPITSGAVGNGSTIAQLKAAVNQLAAVLAKLPTNSAPLQQTGGTVTANLGTLNGAATAANQNSTAAGTSATNGQGIQGITGGIAVAVSWTGQTVGVTGTVTSNQGAPATVANAWPTYLTQGGAVLSGTNGLPTTDTNIAAATSAPGTAPSKAIGVQSASGTPLATAVGQTNTQSAAGTAATTLTGVQGGGAGSLPIIANLSQLAGIALGAPSTYGTAPISGALVPGVNAFITNTPNVLIPSNQNTIGGISATPQGYGVSSFSRLPSSAASTNAAVAKNGGGRVYKIIACNTTTTPARIKFYDIASAPAPGTTAVKFTRPLPAAAAAGGLNCASYDAGDIGWSFSTGISYALTTGAADNDTTAVAAGAITDLSVEYQ